MLFSGQPPVQDLQDFLQISDHGHVCSDIFVDLRRIDINMQHFRLFRKLLRISHHTVGKSRPKRDKQVALADAQIGRLRAVHADHARIRRISSVKGALAKQSITDRRVHLFCKRCQFLRSP